MIHADSEYIIVGQQLRKRRVNGKTEYYVDTSTKNNVVAPVYAPKYLFDALRDEKARQEEYKQKNGKLYK